MKAEVLSDADIVALFFARSPDALTAVQTKFAPYLHTVAFNILASREDAEECVNDTWQAAWERIPPQQPRVLSAFLGRITRNLAISRFRRNTAKRRDAGLGVLLSELEDCVPAGETTEEAFDRKLLGEHISRWLESLPADDRALFLRRYWYGEQLQDLAEETGISYSKLTQRMYRLRLSLKAALEAEGVIL